MLNPLTSSAALTAMPPRPSASEVPAGAGSGRAATPEAAAGAPNPRLSFDPSTGLTVMEFRGSDGTTASLPTPRELTAYKRAVLSGGDLPAGLENPRVRTSVGD